MADNLLAAWITAVAQSIGWLPVLAITAYMIAKFQREGWRRE